MPCSQASTPNAPSPTLPTSSTTVRQTNPDVAHSTKPLHVPSPASPTSSHPPSSPSFHSVTLLSPLATASTFPALLQLTRQTTSGNVGLSAGRRGLKVHGEEG